jgi:hypothetical protein
LGAGNIDVPGFVPHFSRRETLEFGHVVESGTSVVDQNVEKTIGGSDMFHGCGD